MQTYSQMSFVNNYDQETLDLTDDFDESGFKNENLLISPDMILSNIKDVQQNNNVMVSDFLVDSIMEKYKTTNWYNGTRIKIHIIY